jgi:aspartate/methionine/tyrosine aminotransferase
VTAAWDVTAGPCQDSDYPMRRWVFEEAAGRYDIDLGDSHVQCGTLRQLKVPADIELGYGSDRGSGHLRGLIADMYGGDADSAAVTHGSQEALYLLYRTLLRPGDQVITFRPGWQQSWVVPAQLGCRVDVIDLGPDFAINVDVVAEVIGPGLKLIVVNTPGNPTGRLIGERELRALADLAASTDAHLVLDEEYSLDLSRSAAVRGGRIISVSSLSKVYGFPGLRIGWIYGPADLVAACVERKHLTSISNSVLCEALACDVLSRRESYLDQYRRLTSSGLGKLREWAVHNTHAVRLAPPEGTPFGWLWLTTGEPSLSFCRRVLQTGVLVMPAETFGTHGGFRLCFARKPDELAEGLRRIGAVIGSSAHAKRTGAAASRTTTTAVRTNSNTWTV